jgi:hypothetical protein
MSRITLACDELIERHFWTEQLDELAGMWVDAKIYTLSHQLNKILGPIEQRNISSTFLSHLATSLKKFSWLKFLSLPAARNLPIRCGEDYLVTVSWGLGSFFTKCEGTKSVLYLASVENIIHSKLLMKQFQASLKNFDVVMTSNSWLKEFISPMVPEKKVSVIFPIFRTHDFVLDENVPCDGSWAISTEELSGADRKKLINELEEKKQKYFFLEKQCSGELGPKLLQARGLICFNRYQFPFNALSAMAVGRPVYYQNHLEIADWLNTSGNVQFNESDFSFLASALPELSRQKLREHTQKFNELRFKSVFRLLVK